MRRILALTALAILATLGLGVLHQRLASRVSPVVEHPFFSGKAPLVFAHRGGAGLRPENSLVAFRHALEIGTDVLEMDVRHTRDGALVVIHDLTVDRTTDGQGMVSEMSLREIEALDAGYAFAPDEADTYPFRGQGIRVPTLEEVLNAFPETRMNIEIKDDWPDDGIELCRLINATQRQASVLIASFHQAPMDAFRSACPGVATAATMDETLHFFQYHWFFMDGLVQPVAEAFQLPEKLGAFDLVTPRLLSWARRANVRVQVWTVNEPSDMAHLLETGVQGLMTDFPDRLKQLIGQRVDPGSDQD